MTPEDFEAVEAAVAEFNAMSPDDRSLYYEDFFDDWDLTDEMESAFWELYETDQ